MKIKFFPVFLIIIFLVIFFIFYRGLQNSNIYTPIIQNEKTIPNFKAEEFETNKILNSTEIFEEDKFYLLNIWASWCLPCRDEHSYLLNLKKERNLKIIGLNYKDDFEKAKNFLEELNNPYNIIITDKNGTVAIEWGAYGVPESFLVYDKKIIKKIIGPLNQSSFFEIKGLVE